MKPNHTMEMEISQIVCTLPLVMINDDTRIYQHQLCNIKLAIISANEKWKKRAVSYRLLFESTMTMSKIISTYLIFQWIVNLHMVKWEISDSNNISDPSLENTINEQWYDDDNGILQLQFFKRLSEYPPSVHYSRVDYIMRDYSIGSSRKDP